MEYEAKRDIEVMSSVAVTKMAIGLRMLLSLFSGTFGSLGSQPRRCFSKNFLKVTVSTPGQAGRKLHMPV